MHGRVKVRTSAEQEAIKQVQRAERVAQYNAALNLIFEKRKNKVYDQELLVITERTVLQNTDAHTIWNIRREAFQNNEWSKEEYVGHLMEELELTRKCLFENPKSYSVWHQRCWVIDHLPEPDWDRELQLCAQCLNLDERNFHCWDYRNYLVKKAGISDSDEFEFSSTKIFKNFSNYSSWHYRSKILSKMFPDESGELPIKADKHKEELDLVMNATFTDPNDSSAWFYQRWLLDYSREQPNTLWRAKVTKKNAILIFRGESSVETEMPTLFIDNIEISVTWCSYNNQKYSKLWIATFQNDTFNLQCSDLSIGLRTEKLKLHKSTEYDAWFYKSNISPVDRHNKIQLKEQMDSYEQLKEMEPNNKWALLTGIFLMKNYDLVGYHEKILEDLKALIKIDKLRFNYYNDIRSKCIMDYKLHILWQNEKDAEMNSTIDLSDLGLTVFYNEHYFSLFEEVNLGANELERSLQRLRVLQECKKLSLSSNNLKTLKKFPTLQSLQVLSLRNNELVDSSEILNIIKRHKLVKLDLRDNPLCTDSEIVKKISEICPSLELQID